MKMRRKTMEKKASGFSHSVNFAFVLGCRHSRLGVRVHLYFAFIVRWENKANPGGKRNKVGWVAEIERCRRKATGYRFWRGQQVERVDWLCLWGELPYREADERMRWGKVPYREADEKRAAAQCKLPTAAWHPVECPLAPFGPVRLVCCLHKPSKWNEARALKI